MVGVSNPKERSRQISQRLSLRYKESWYLKLYLELVEMSLTGLGSVSIVLTTIFTIMSMHWGEQLRISVAYMGLAFKIVVISVPWPIDSCSKSIFYFPSTAINLPISISPSISVPRLTQSQPKHL